MLPVHLIDDLQAAARVAGAPGTTLAYSWVTSAARSALAGRYADVPDRSWAPTTAGAQRKVDIPLTAEESERLTEALRLAGSSMRAVIAACTMATTEAGGSAVAMRWPDRSAPVELRASA